MKNYIRDTLFRCTRAADDAKNLFLFWLMVFFFQFIFDMKPVLKYKNMKRDFYADRSTLKMSKDRY